LVLAGLGLLFDNKNAGAAIGCVVIGAGLLLAAVFGSRMVGTQKFAASGIELNLDEAQDAVASAEQDLKAGNIVSAEEVIE
jgi:hypothetical protein